MSRLFSRQRGSGPVLLFIHGFPMHQGIWDHFSEHFIREYSVVTIDLPGFGKSPLPIKSDFSLADVADEVIAFAAGHKLDNFALIGHSLGGYVALEIAARRPELLSSLILFHSTAVPDSAERKDSRNKVIEFVKKNGASSFTTGFIAPLFADQQHAEIERVKQIAATTGPDTVIGYSRAMRDRQDHVKTLRNFEKHTLLIGGEKDAGIPVQTIYEQAKGSKNAEIHILRNVGHMGMIENTVESASVIKDFLKKT